MSARSQKGKICACYCEKLISLSLTSFSQLEFRVSKAIGLLGALLPGPGGMPPWSEDWLGQGKLNTWEPSFPRYRFTCCCWERWMWYLVGFSRWVWTYWWKKKGKKAREQSRKVGKWVEKTKNIYVLVAGEMVEGATREINHINTHLGHTGK